MLRGGLKWGVTHESETCKNNDDTVAMVRKQFLYRIVLSQCELRGSFYWSAESRAHASEETNVKVIRRAHLKLKAQV